MNKDEVANVVVNEQLNRMLEQERKNCEVTPMPEVEHMYPSYIIDHAQEAILYMIVNMKISLISRLN